MFKANKKSSSLQTSLSLVILAALSAIGIGLVYTQFSFNPAVLEMSTTISSNGSSPQVQKNSPDDSLLPLPENMVSLSPPEIFDSQNLSDKINGKAELYLSAGFVRLRTQRFADERIPALWIETFVYDMGSEQNAFSVFSTQRRNDAEPLAITQYSYKTQNALFLVHGPYYLEIIASEASEKAFQSLQSIAESFIHHIRTEAKAITEENLFPKPNLAQNSIALISSDAFGCEHLDRVFTAIYELSDAELMAFLSHRNTPREAETLVSTYHQFLIAYGGLDVETDVPIQGAKMVNILDTYEVIFSHGTYLAGVREAPDKNQAQELAVRLFKKIKEATDESGVGQQKNK